jgi:ferrochelatase
LSDKPDTAILLMAYGSPDSLDEIEPYLLDIRSGRPVSPGLLAEIKHRYALIGGRSPLLDLTRAQAQALEKELNSRNASHGTFCRAYVGMRHWQPRIREAVEQIRSDGIKRLVAIVMAPHSSRMSTGAYFAGLQEAVAEIDPDLQIIPVESWYDHPGLIAALAERVATAGQSYKTIQPHHIFTAHSLPARILDQGDLYDAQLRRTATLLAERLELPSDRWSFCYQSAGQSSEPWLGPQLEAFILELVQSGHRNLLVTPIGFVCDHVEVLYDIDIAARARAESHGARLERSESLNTSPLFISALADLVTTALAVPTR